MIPAAKVAQAIAEKVHLADAFVWIDPQRRSGDPCINGTRITTEQVADYVAAGLADELVRDFELSPAQVAVGCWYEALRGTKPEWEKWAHEASMALHRGNVPALPE